MSERLALHKALYDGKRVAEAAEAYRDLACIRISEDTQYWFCEFSDCVYHTRITMREFENYVIELANVVRNKNDFM